MQIEPPQDREDTTSHELQTAKEAHEQEIAALKQSHEAEIAAMRKKLVSSKGVKTLSNKRLRTRLQKVLKDSRIYRMVSKSEHARTVEELEDEVFEAKQSKESATDEIQKKLEAAQRSKTHAFNQHKKLAIELKELKATHGDLQQQLANIKQRYTEVRNEREQIWQQLLSERSQYGTDQQSNGISTDLVVANHAIQDDLAQGNASLLEANKGLSKMVSSLRTELDDKSMTIVDLRTKLGRGDRKAVYSETQEQLGRALGRVRQWQSYVGELQEHVFAEMSLLDGDRATLKSQLVQLEEELLAKDKELASLTKTYDFCVAQRKTDLEERVALDERCATSDRCLQKDVENIKEDLRKKGDECFKQTKLAERLQVRNDDLMKQQRVLLVDMAEEYTADTLVQVMSFHIQTSIDDVKVLEEECRRQDAEYDVAQNEIRYYRNRVNEVDIEFKKVASQEQRIRELESENERIVLDMEIHGDLKKELENAQQVVKQLTIKLKLKSKDTEWAKIVAEKAQSAEKHCLQYLRGRVAELTAASENARRREKKLHEEIDILKQDVELSQAYNNVEERFGDPVATIEAFKAERDQAITERNEAVEAVRVLESKLTAIYLQERSLSPEDIQMRDFLQACYVDEHNKFENLQTQFTELYNCYTHLERVKSQLEGELAMRVAQIEGNPGIVVRRISELGTELQEQRIMSANLMADKAQLRIELAAAVQPAPQFPWIFKLQDDVQNLMKRLDSNNKMHNELFEYVQHGISDGMRQKLARLESEIKEKDIRIQEVQIKNLLLHCPRDMDFILQMDTRPGADWNTELMTNTCYRYEYYDDE